MFTRVLAPLMAVCFFAGALSGQTMWLGTTSTDWNTASNWSTATVPTIATNVEIAPSPNIPLVPVAGASCNNLTILPGATLNGGGTIATAVPAAPATGGTLTVEGNFINNGTYTAVQNSL